MKQITITNRQRLQAVDLEELQIIAEKLWHALFEDLSLSPPHHLNKIILKKMQTQALLAIVLLSNHSIRKLNKQWRNLDYATDVLSFPLMLEPPVSGTVMPWELGEIFISLEKAQDQAHCFGHSFEREWAFLSLHGMLHILGFDHEDSEAEKEMFGRQEKILTNAGFPRRKFIES